MEFRKNRGFSEEPMKWLEKVRVWGVKRGIRNKATSHHLLPKLGAGGFNLFLYDNDLALLAPC